MAVIDVERHHQDLVDELIAAVEEYNPGVDKELLARAFRFAATAHEGQARSSGEPFVHHPWAVAKICAELHLDEPSLAAALLHDVVEDTDVEPDDLRSEFGDEIAQLVEGVTKLTRTSFQTREQSDAENYRKMIVAMAQDVRVILIKLADRLHNMRTIEYQGKQAQVRKAKETLEVYAPLAHRLGIHAMKWELEDRSFEILHPRKYAEIKAMVADRRADREAAVEKAGEVLGVELEKVDIPAEIAGRAKHFYSIYDKMAKKGREFNEIYDLTAMRVTVERAGDEGTRDCYGALGLIHSLWKPMPGRFKDFIAMPKFNRYRSLHTTVIGPEGTPLEIQVRTREMHEEAEYGIAAHWLYKRGKGKQDDEWLTWVKSLLDWQENEADPREFMKTLPHRPLRRRGVRLHAEGRGEDAAAGRDADRLRLRRAHRRRAQDGRRQDQRPHRPAPLPAQERRLRRDPDLEVGPRPVARLDEPGRVVTGAQQDPAVVPARDARRDGGEGPRDPRQRAEGAEPPVPEAAGLGGARPGDPRDRLPQGGGLLRRARRRASSSPGQIVNKVLQRLKTEEVAEEAVVPLKPPRARSTVAGEHPRDQGAGDRGRARAAREVLHAGARRPDPRLHLARSRDHDPPRGLPEREGADAESRAVHAGRVGGRRDHESFRVQIAVDSFDRARLLEDVARSFAEHGANIVSYGGVVEDGMARNWYTAEVGDVKELRALLTVAAQPRGRLRRVPRRPLASSAGRAARATGEEAVAVVPAEAEAFRLARRR